MFAKGQVTVIPQQNLCNQWLVVLPNLTRGKLVSVTRNIVTCDVIKNVNDMRDYWKEVYGYILPEDFGAFYCNISFGQHFDKSGFTNEIYCYPREASKSKMGNNLL